MHRAAVMNNHGARGNRPDGRSRRIKSLIALDRVGFLAGAMQAMRQYAQQMRSRYISHRAVVERAFRHRDPNAQFIVVEARFAECFVLMPRRGMASMAGFEYCVIAGKLGARAQQLPGRGKRDGSIR